MWLFVLLGLNILMMGALYVLYRRQVDLQHTSLEIKKLSRRVDGMPGRQFAQDVNNQMADIADYFTALDSRLHNAVSATNNLHSDHMAVVEQVNTMLTISEELSEELFSVKDALEELDASITALDGYIDDLNEGNTVIEQGFYATVSSITKLQEAQKVTRDLLDATIDSFEWEDDDLPVANNQSENIANSLPKASSLPPVSADEEPPIVAPRQDNDPIITDLRAVPFEEANVSGPDPYAIGFTPDVEEWPTDFSSSTNKNSTSRSKTRGIRRLR